VVVVEVVVVVVEVNVDRTMVFECNNTVARYTCTTET
jgi:hypothetical protein